MKLDTLQKEKYDICKLNYFGFYWTFVNLRLAYSLREHVMVLSNTHILDFMDGDIVKTKKKKNLSMVFPCNYWSSSSVKYASSSGLGLDIAPLNLWLLAAVYSRRILCRLRVPSLVEWQPWMYQRGWLRKWVLNWDMRFDLFISLMSCSYLEMFPCKIFHHVFDFVW